MSPGSSDGANPDIASSWRSRHLPIEQLRGDIARTFLEIPDHATPIGAASHQSGGHRRKLYVNPSNSGIRKVSLHAFRKDDNGLAGLDDSEAFARRRYHGPPRDRNTRWRVVGKMDRRPGPYLMIVGQCRDNFVRELLRIDQGFLRQSVADRHDQFPTHGCQRAIGQSAGRRVAHRCARADPNVGRCDGDAGRSREIGALIQSVYAAINARAAFAAPCTGPSAPMVTRLR
jgi:hypothetical protein